MNKKNWIILSILIVLFICGGIFFYLKSTSSVNQSNYEANKTSSKNSFNQVNQTESPNTTNEQTKGIAESQETPSIKEEQISTFTTKIYSTDPARQNNISITCTTLNGTIVKNGSIFSFCSTVGESSSSKGYQKADIFDKNGNKKKGLGGRKLSN